MKIILSIKPKYVKEIFEGNKLYEYRKSIFRQDVDTVIIYASSPVCMIVGEFSIDKVLSGSPEHLWLMTRLNSGIEKPCFDAYFSNREIAYVIKIADVKKYSRPCKLSALCPNSRPPQSFMYFK